MNGYNRLEIVASLLCIALSILVSPAVSAQSLRPVMIAVSNPKEISAAPMLLAKYLGYFGEEGVDVQFVVMSSDISMKGLMTGDVDFTSSVSSVVKAAAVGLPVKTVMNFFNGSFFYLLTKPEITSINQLRNKIVAISRYGSATDFDVRAALSHFNIDPNKDVKILAVGGGSARIAGLISGRVDAALLNNVEKIAAEKAGMRALLFTGEYVKQPIGGLGASVRQLAEARDKSRRTLKAVYRASIVMQKEPEKVKEFMVRSLDVNPEQSNSIYADMMKVFLPDGKISLQALAAPYEDARKQAANAPAVPLSALVDYSLLNDIEATAR
jgi:ABC-type nitrate/sulfonate/bicarbonate transport system substrate-binding protein